MPLYEYKCTVCEHEFEDIVSYRDRDEGHICTLCGSKSIRKKVFLFGIHTRLDPKKDTIYSGKEIDKVVGEATEEKWKGYDKRWQERYKKRQEKRWNGKKPEAVNIPKDNDGKYSPIMHLGNKKERTIRKRYTEAIQEHKEKGKDLSGFEFKSTIKDG
jgi:putative FmdB family regulatory protein